MTEILSQLETERWLHGLLSRVDHHARFLKFEVAASSFLMTAQHLPVEASVNTGGM